MHLSAGLPCFMFTCMSCTAPHLKITHPWKKKNCINGLHKKKKKKKTPLHIRNVPQVSFQLHVGCSISRSNATHFKNRQQRNEAVINCFLHLIKNVFSFDVNVSNTFMIKCCTIALFPSIQRFSHVSQISFRAVICL